MHNFIITDSIRETINKYTATGIITNQLSFYPINVDAVVNRDKELFIHKEYLYFFLAEAYCHYL